MNKAIIDNKVLETKAEQEAKFAAFAKAKGNTDYEKVVSEIDAASKRVILFFITYTCFRESLSRRYRIRHSLSDSGQAERSNQK